MEMQEFLDQLEQTIFRYDLLQHPFYQAWSRGELALEDLREYARDYYHQVESFPGYLLRFAARLERGDPRAAVLANLRDEVGGGTRRSHSDLWLDFVEGMGAERPLAGHKPSSQIFDLVLFFEQMAKQGSREEVLAASMPTNRKCRECRGKNGEDLLRNTAQASAPVVISSSIPLPMSTTPGSGSAQLEKHLRAHPERSYAALKAAEAAARALWRALDGIEVRSFGRLKRVAPSATLAGSNELPR